MSKNIRESKGPVERNALLDLHTQDFTENFKCIASMRSSYRRTKHSDLLQPK